MPSSIGNMGTPFMFDDSGSGGGAEPVATESTLKDIHVGLSIMQSDLTKTQALFRGVPSTLLAINLKLNKEGVLHEALNSIAHILETSAIARHSDSSLDIGLAALKESNVTFNEKTLRWHDDQTNLMVKKTDPRVAEAIAPKKSAVEKAVDDGMVTEKKIGLGFIAGQLKTIQETLWSANHILFGMHDAAVGTAEDSSEDDRAEKNQAKENKKQTGFLSGMWGKMKEKAKKNWFVENWKLLLAGLVLLFAPLKWIRKLWDWVVKIWEFFAGKKVETSDIEAKEKEIQALKDNKGSDFFGIHQRKIDAAEEELEQMKEDKESGKRIGGLFGVGGILDGFEFEIIAITAGLILFGPAIAGVVGGIIAATTVIGKGVSALGGAAKWAKNLFKTKKVPGTTKLDKGLKKPKGWDKMSDVEQKKFNKAGGSKPSTAPKGTGAAGTKPPTATTGRPTATTKPAGGPGLASKLGEKAGKWKKSFPRLAKGLKLAGKVPHLGKIIAVGTIATMLARGASGKEIAPVLGGILGGVGGAVLGGIGGAMIGGPFAPITGLLGSIGGGFFGGIIGEGLAQWLLGMKVTAMPFDMMNDAMNGIEQKEAGGDSSFVGGEPDEMDIMGKELEEKAAVAGSDASGKTETLVQGKKVGAVKQPERKSFGVKIPKVGIPKTGGIDATPVKVVGGDDTFISQMSGGADEKMEYVQGVMEQNQIAKAQQASPGPTQVSVNSTTSNQSSSAGDVNTFAQAGAHSNKTLKTSMV